MDGARILHLGYRGAQQLFDTICNMFLEHQQKKSPVGFSYM
jgi:nitrogenase molybdenum-iron protein NifN